MAPIEIDVEEILKGNEGDTKAWANLWEACYRLSRSKGVKNYDAEDIASNSVLKILSKLDTFDVEKGNFNQWYNSIVRHTLVDNWRSNKRKSEFASLDDAFDLPDPPNANMHEGSEVARFLIGYRSLRPLVCKEFEGVPYSVLAEEMGLKPATLRWKAFESKKFARKLVENYFPDVAEEYSS